MDDRYSRYGQRDYGRDREPADYGHDYGSGRDYTYSSARDYAAAGEQGRRERSAYGAGARGYRDDALARERGYRSDFDRPRYAAGQGGWGGDRAGYRGDYRNDHREEDRHEHRGGYGSEHRGENRGGHDRYAGNDRDDDRGFFARAGDEVRSWFGDGDAERRREADMRYDERQGRSERWNDSTGRDEHYQSWRRERIAELDRDYDEYRRENSQRFSSEFGNWRSERQTQRDSLSRVAEHMEVLGSDGSHVGTVDKVRGDRILLTKNDADAGGHHHSIPSRWIQTVDTKVTLRKTADEAKAHWKDEEGGAMFGENSGESRDADRNDWRSDRNLNRSFSGTY